MLRRILNISSIWICFYIITIDLLSGYKTSIPRKSLLVYDKCHDLHVSSRALFLSKAVQDIRTTTTSNRIKEQYFINLLAAIRNRQVNDMIDLITSYNVSYHMPVNGRTIINYITYNCYNMNRHEYASILLDALSEDHFNGLTDYELIPFLQNCMNVKTVRYGHDVIKSAALKGLQVTPKAYSILIQGNSHA